MSSVRGDTRVISTCLSQTLADIGVNADVVRKRRRFCLHVETMRSLSKKLGAYDSDDFIFGSQSEGTTTIGLNSDSDKLICLHFNRIVQDMQECRFDKKLNLMMIQGDAIPPGYCRLMICDRLLSFMLRQQHNVSFQEALINAENLFLLKNTYIHDLAKSCYKVSPLAELGETHGPSNPIFQMGYLDKDIVYAFLCKTWPKQANRWLTRPRPGHWPTRSMLQYCERTGCFLVPVGARASVSRDLEWRISPSLTERCLIFSLNIIQIGCYVVLKMLMKTFVIPAVGDSLSSFHCKTALFYCVEQTKPELWVDDKLVLCVVTCLEKLRTWLHNLFCPQFLIPEENMFAGKISAQQRDVIIPILSAMITDLPRFLLKIEIDDIGQRLMMKCNGSPHGIRSTFETKEDLTNRLFGTFSVQYANVTQLNVIIATNQNESPGGQYRIIQDLVKASRHANTVTTSVIRCLLPSFFSTLGSMIASSCIQRGSALSPAVEHCFQQGCKSDVASSKLKLASIYYCVGDLEKASVLLQDVDTQYNREFVETACNCHDVPYPKFKTQYSHKAYSIEDEATLLKETSAFCVRFTPSEIFSAPKELQYEYFRRRTDGAFPEIYDVTRKWATVDSLPFMYFLQYMVYRRLEGRGRPDILIKMLVCIVTELNLRHHETAFNLLGQCFELEGDLLTAANCYIASFYRKPFNNVACWLIGSLVGKIIAHRR